jgi:hypothetical protein
MAVMDHTSSLSTPHNLSQACILSAMTDESFTAWMTEIQRFEGCRNRLPSMYLCCLAGANLVVKLYSLSVFVVGNDRIPWQGISFSLHQRIHYAPSGVIALSWGDLVSDL